MSVVYDPIAQAGELIEELRDLSQEAGEFRFGDDEDTAIEFERTFVDTLKEVVTLKVLGEHSEIEFTAEECEIFQQNGYQLGVAIREMREGMAMLRERLPDAFQRVES